MGDAQFPPVDEVRWYSAPEGWEKKRRKPRKVFLPLQNLDHCSVCESDGPHLRLCASCLETTYCSTDCQRADWSVHKPTCGKTEKIDFRSFFAFLAVLFEIAVGHPKRPLHPALTHQIINSPGPGGPYTTLPDGTSAVLVKLGKEIEFNPGAKEWWSSPDNLARYTLYHRILREGWLLPNYFGICLAILAEIYTTTAVRASPDDGVEEESRIRLGVYGSPLADFGIAVGTVEARTEDRLAYLSLGDDKPSLGQNNQEHFWLYFRTIRGQVYHLDCGLYALNVRNVVSDIKQYAHDLDFGFLEPAPALWIGKTGLRHMPETHTMKRQFSFLRDPRLHHIVRSASLHFEEDSDRKAIGLILEEIAGRKCSETEKLLAVRYTEQNRMTFITVLSNKSWTEWPKEPTITVQEGPSSQKLAPEDAVVFGDLVRQLKNGKISSKEEMLLRWTVYMNSKRK